MVQIQKLQRQVFEFVPLLDVGKVFHFFCGDTSTDQFQYITGQICSVSTAPVRFSGKGWGSGLYQRKEKTLCSWGDFVKLVTGSFSGFFLYWAVGIFPVGISRPLLGEVSVLSVFFEGPNIWTGICLCVTTPPWKPRFFSRVLDGLTVLTGLVLNNRADLSGYVLKLLWLGSSSPLALWGFARANFNT